mgnify:CR=1 FL=1
MNIIIEYCTVWNYLPRAAGLANELLGKYGTQINRLTMEPSGGGVYEITKDDSLIFSKKKLDRFPDDGEIINLIEKN